MEQRSWKTVAEVYFGPQAQILRGLLESQGITVHISQEGYANALGVTVDLGRIEVMVPNDQYDQALQILDDYDDGLLESDEDLGGDQGSED